MNRNFVLGVAAVAGLAFSASAAAAPDLSSSAYPYGNTWLVEGESDIGNKVAGEIYWDIFTDLSGSYFVFSIKNTSEDGSRITGFAWDFPAGVSYGGSHASSVPDQDGDITSWIFSFGGQKLPGQDSLFGACTYPKSNCQAASGDGIGTSGPSAGYNWFWVQLSGSATIEQWDAVRACLRFGSVGSKGQDSGVGCNDGSFDFDVPEPSSLALLGLGLIGVGLARRRKLVA